MNAKVLVVEDEEPLALLLQYNLEAEGFRVSVANRGDEAESVIKEEPPDLIILDWMLPGLSGIELCRRLRVGKASCSIPILILTARGARAGPHSRAHHRCGRLRGEALFRARADGACEGDPQAREPGAHGPNP